jgi:hypothetical protein
MATGKVIKYDRRTEGVLSQSMAAQERDGVSTQNEAMRVACGINA